MPEWPAAISPTSPTESGSLSDATGGLRPRRGIEVAFDRGAHREPGQEQSQESRREARERGAGNGIDHQDGHEPEREPAGARASGREAPGQKDQPPEDRHHRRQAQQADVRDRSEVARVDSDSAGWPRWDPASPCTSPAPAAVPTLPTPCPRNQTFGSLRNRRHASVRPLTVRKFDVPVRTVRVSVAVDEAKRMTQSAHRRDGQQEDRRCGVALAREE